MSKCTIVDKGMALARIISQEESWRPSQEATRELLTGIAKATGVRLPVDSSKVFAEPLEPIRQTPVVIRFNISSPQESSLGKDGFRIRVAARSLDFDASTKSGFLNAVYTFLAQYCGFVWLWPGPDGEVYDQVVALSVPIGQIQEKPDYLWRFFEDSDPDRYLPGKWTDREFHMHPHPVARKVFHLWCQRNRMGGLKVRVGHTWGEMINPDIYGKTHPEYFAQIKGSRQTAINNWTGKHNGQLCTSNAEVIDLLAEKVRFFFDENPEYDVCSISPNDGSGFCECDNCIALDVSFGNPPPVSQEHKAGALEATFKDDADKSEASSRITGPITDRIFTFANQLAEKIAESHPEKFLILLVYSSYHTAPRQVKLAPNIIAQYCVASHEHWDRDTRDADLRNLQALADKTEELAIYGYHDQGAWPGVVRSFPDLLADSLRSFSKLGVRYYITQSGGGFSVNGFNLWFLAKALWNSSSDVDAAYDKYCSKAFGSAGGSMKAYFNLWRNQWKRHKGISQLGEPIAGSELPGGRLASFDQIRRLYPTDFLDKCAQEIENARGAVPELSTERRRIDFIAHGLEATRIAVEAANISYQLAEQGWPMTYDAVTEEAVSNLGPPEEVKRKAQHALSYWDRWEGYIEAHRNDFVLNHFGARYGYDSRKWMHPHHNLHRILNFLEGTSS